MTHYNIGKTQTLIVKRFTGIGVYLNTVPFAEDLEEAHDSDILLPAGDVPDDCEIGDALDVFVYRDSEDRLIATTKTPLAEKGDIALLEVDSVGGVGAFLKWGLTKDLLLPFAEQKRKLKRGDKVVVYVYLDSTDRLSASTKIEKFLAEDHAFDVGASVEGTIYSIHPDIGAFVAVNNRYKALIPRREMVGDLKLGGTVSARITRVHPDGKINLALREKTSVQIHLDVDVLKDALERAGGFLPYHDKSDADDIRREFDMSKKAFKRAVGVLLKRGEIEIKENGIALK